VLLLEGREWLHRLVLQIAPVEVFTLGKFLILVGIVLPLVPNHPIISWTPITPFQVWLALVAISTLSYASYLLQRYLPMKTGALLPGILGGFYSSTATTVALARRQKIGRGPERGYRGGHHRRDGGHVSAYRCGGGAIQCSAWPGCCCRR
jgi:uncharacterized membrane protein (DUF4010 family)